MYLAVSNASLIPLQTSLSAYLTRRRSVRMVNRTFDMQFHHIFFEQTDEQLTSDENQHMVSIYGLDAVTYHMLLAHI